MELLYWHWWVLGLALLVIEMFLPTGFVLIWIGAAALITGLLAWLLPALHWQLEMVIFAVSSLLSFFAWKKIRPMNPGSDQPTLNRRGASYVGRSFTLGEAIVNGVGRLRVDDSQWRISGPDLPAGARVRVSGVEGSTLQVEQID